MISRDKVEAVLSRIRPLLQADGGDIVLGDSARGGLNVTLRIPV